MQTIDTAASSPGVLKGKYVVLMDLPWLPPGIRENSMDLFGLAAEKVAKGRPSRPGIYPLSDFAGKWWYATASDMRYCCGAYSTEQIAGFLTQGKSVRAIQGPFDTEGQAEYALDVSWEAPD